VLIRQNGPVFGLSASAYLDPGSWEWSLAYRTLDSSRRFRGSFEQFEREDFGTYVVNQQRMADVSATYAVSKRVSVGLGVPVVQASWGTPNLKIEPGKPSTLTDGPRNNQVGRGIGDVSAKAQAWLFKPADHATGNVALSLGVKAPRATRTSRISIRTSTA